jgi:hypothetical protein
LILEKTSTLILVLNIKFKQWKSIEYKNGGRDGRRAEMFRVIQLSGEVSGLLEMADQEFRSKSQTAFGESQIRSKDN